MPDRGLTLPDQQYRAVFRCDASAAMGTGHVVRSGTLASELRRRGWHTTVVSRETTDALSADLASRGHRVLLVPQDVSLEDEPSWLATVGGAAGSQIVVVDSYRIGRPWETAAKALGSTVVVIDDLADRPHDADIVLNQNLGTITADYRDLVAPECLLLIGPTYALLRPEFAARRAEGVAERGAVHRVLIFLSGGDEHDVTGRAARAMAGLDLEIDIVLGGAYRHGSGLRDWARKERHVRILTNVADMAELMAGADLSIGAPSSASWERCCLGVPALLIGLAENQRRVAAELVQRGAAELIGWHDEVDDADIRTAIDDLLRNRARVRAMSRAARTITDGRGASRVADALTALVEQKSDPQRSNIHGC